MIVSVRFSKERPPVAENGLLGPAPVSGKVPVRQPADSVLRKERGILAI